MSRTEILKKIGINVLPQAKIRLIIDSDCSNEADDHFAIMHQLLSPSLDVCGIIATHFERKKPTSKTMMDSYNEINHLLKLAKMEEIPVYKGSVLPIQNGVEESEGALAIIKEAKKEGKLYISCQGALTNVACALKIDPSISSNIVILWNGGETYGTTIPEFNVQQDIKAAQIICSSDCEIWQTPQNVYAALEVPLSELKLKVYPCGEVGKYMYENIISHYEEEYNPYFKLRTGENWTLGDNAIVAMLLSTHFRGQTSVRPRPLISDEGHYLENPNGKEMIVFNSIDARFTLEDLFAKLSLANL